MNKEDVDSVVAERDELRIRVEAQSSEIGELRHVNASQTSAVESYEAMRLDLVVANKRIGHLEALLDETKRRVALLDKSNYDTTTESDALRADMRLLQQELGSKSLEVSNFNTALQQLQKERDAWMRQSTEDKERQISSIREEFELHHKKNEATWLTRVDEQREAVALRSQDCQDESLLRRKAELELNAEKRRMQKTLQSALFQLQNSQEGVVDKTLIANLVVSYFQRKRLMIEE